MNREEDARSRNISQLASLECSSAIALLSECVTQFEGQPTIETAERFCQASRVTWINLVAAAEASDDVKAFIILSERGAALTSDLAAKTDEATTLDHMAENCRHRKTLAERLLTDGIDDVVREMSSNLNSFE